MTKAWVLSLGPVARWGIEGASGLGRHTSAWDSYSGTGAGKGNRTFETA
jgi:hypothetical protein